MGIRRAILKRTESFAATIGDYVDIWEVGNEINGEWVRWKGEEQNGGIAEHEQQTDPNKLKVMRMLVGEQVPLIYKTLKSHPKIVKNCAEIALNLYLKDDHTGKRECY